MNRRINRKDFIRKILMPFMKENGIQSYADIELKVKPGAQISFTESKLGLSGTHKRVNLPEKDTAYKEVYRLVNNYNFYIRYPNGKIGFQKVIRNPEKDSKPIGNLEIGRLSVVNACTFTAEKRGISLEAKEYSLWLKKQDPKKYPPKAWKEENKKFNDAPKELGKSTLSLNKKK